MNYTVELYDVWGRRVARFHEVPLLEVIRTAPDQADTIRGVLPAGVPTLSPGYRVRVLLDGTLAAEATVTSTGPEWSDTRKLILDRYVNFHEVIAFEAERPARDGNTTVTRAYTNQTVQSIVKDLINRALGPVHYYVDHATYPEGAQREYAKFIGRKSAANELEVGGIDAGQWVDSARMDLTNAVAKDGDTIEGIKVDGADWPDLRLMLIDCEETSRNSHAEKRHPEVADWTDAQYNASGYKARADAATTFLQGLIDTDGIESIELNPHVDASGAFDDRVDAYGRYLGLVYGGAKCFNAAIVEQDLADVYLFADGAFHVPELELKDFFSYVGVHQDSIESASAVLASYDAAAGVFEALTAMAYAAGGYVWSGDNDDGIRFRAAWRPDRVVYFDPVEHGVLLGSDVASVVNIVYFDGNPVTSQLSKTYVRGESADEYTAHARAFDFFALSLEEDADTIVDPLLDDVAYPAPTGRVTFLHGDSSVQVGDLVEVRGGASRRLEHELANEWGGRFTGKLVGRIRAVEHRLLGGQVVTQAHLTAPLRSVDNPISFMVRSQPNADSLFGFRLDDAGVGLDSEYYLG